MHALDTYERRTLAAIVDRLVPEDEHGPGGVEAGVVRYVERSLAGELLPLRTDYVAGLAAVDAYARGRFGASFADLAAADQEAVLEALERGDAPGFGHGSQVFFELVRRHAVEGMFGDPAYGGNDGLAGWRLIGFPGVRRAVPAEHQTLDAVVETAQASLRDHGLAPADTRA